MMHADKKIGFVRIPSPHRNRVSPTPKLLLDAGTGRGPGDSLRVDDFSSLFGTHPESEFRTLVGDLQSAQVMHQVPSVFRLDDVGKRRHRRAVKAGHENLIEIMVGRAALEAGAGSKIVGPNRLIVAVRKRGSGRTIAAAFGAMALPAFQLGEEFFSVLDAIHGERGLGGNIDDIAGLVGLPARREGFDESDEIRAVLVRQGDPRRHVGIVKTTDERVDEILVRWQSACRRRSALVRRRDEIPRQNIEVWPIFTVAVAEEAVATPAVAKVQLSSGAHVPSIFADVGFSLLRRCGQRESESCKDDDTEYS